MVELRASFRQIPTLILWLLLFAFLGALAILFLRLEPEHIALGEEIGNVLTTLCLAYVGGFITSFLWHHLRRVVENRKGSELRLSIIQTMAEGHNYFMREVIEGSQQHPNRVIDYSTLTDEDISARARKGWSREQAAGSLASSAEYMESIRDGAFTYLREEFADFKPLLSVLHPTFVQGLGRIERELRQVTRVHQDNPLSGPLNDLERIRRDIQRLRYIHVQIERGAKFSLLGAIPALTTDELVARGVPRAMIDKMNETPPPLREE